MVTVRKEDAVGGEKQLELGWGWVLLDERTTHYLRCHFTEIRR